LCIKTVAIINQKGAAGKTTLAVRLAVAATQAHHTVAIVNLDPQATAASWGDRRDAPSEVI
jgi:chromosome partitioning protein